MQNPDIKEKYRELVENANSIIMRMDVSGNVTFFNEFAQKFFGYPENEILGKNIIGTIVPQSDFSGSDLSAMIKDLLAHPRKYINNENENITRDGRHVWISWTNKPVLDEHGKLKEILSIGNDISRLKKTELELSKARELAESAGNVGTIICLPDCKIKAINSAAKRYFQFDAAEGSGQNALEVILKRYKPSISENELRDFSAPHLTFELVRHETENNKALYLQVNREIIKNPQQEAVSIIFSVHDITDQKKEELLKQDFLGLISHKLRTPIAVILQSALILQKDKTIGGQPKVLLNGLVDEAYRLNELIANLLNFVMINNQNITASKEEILLSECLPQLINPVLAQAKGKTINLNIDCPDKNLTISMNRNCFNFMVRNLVDNAIKFCDKPAIELKISAKKDNNKICLSVLDNGPGIAVEEQERIFEKFYQPEKYFTGNVAGAGLGLPLVKKIVASYGGAINLLSTLGQGAAFIITLPD